jgi:protein TonB
MLARRQGWEGQVKLALRIEPDGHISHLQLAQSSGYAGLDAAALASARRIELLDNVSTRLQGAYLDMVLPIEYRLLGG